MGIVNEQKAAQVICDSGLQLKVHDKFPNRTAIHKKALKYINITIVLLKKY